MVGLGVVERRCRGAYGDRGCRRARTGESIHLQRVAALEGGGGQRALGVGGRVDRAGGDVEFGGLNGVGEVVALEELVAGDLPVVRVVAQGSRGIVVCLCVVVLVVSGHHGCRVGTAALQGRGHEGCGRVGMLGAPRPLCACGAPRGRRHRGTGLLVEGSAGSAGGAGAAAAAAATAAAAESV